MDEIYKLALKEKEEELEETKKLLAKAYIFLLKYDPEVTPPHIRSDLLNKIKTFMDGGTIH